MRGFFLVGWFWFSWGFCLFGVFLRKKHIPEFKTQNLGSFKVISRWDPTNIGPVAIRGMQDILNSRSIYCFYVKGFWISEPDGGVTLNTRLCSTL